MKDRLQEYKRQITEKLKKPIGSGASAKSAASPSASASASASLASFSGKLKAFGQRSALVGVDPGSWSIKAIQCDNHSAPFAIRNCVQTLRSEDAAEQTVKESLAKLGYQNNRGAFSLADEKVENHEFHLPALPKKELETAVEWEIKKTIASPDYVFHDVLTFPGTEGFDVQCVVSAKDVVKNRFEEGKQLGLRPTFLETESSALLACLGGMKIGRPLNRIAILDLGYSTFRLIFLHKERVSFTRSLYFGLATLNHLVASQLGIMPQEVQRLYETLRVDQPVDPSQAAGALLERSLQEQLYTLCEEFRRSEFFIRDQKSFEEIEEVYVCGGGACLPFVVDYLAKHLSDKKFVVLNPFLKVKSLPAGIDPAQGPLWACALGLSLRGKT